MRDLLRSAAGERLGLVAYDADFAAAVATVDGPILRTQRLQTLREPGNPAWEAFTEGRWDEALRLAAEPDPETVRFFDQLDKAGSGLRRLRVVERPLSAYLLWELHVLRHRAQAGERIRVLGAERLTGFEDKHGRIPELMVLGDRVLYEVMYDPAGTPVGARKVVEPGVVRACRVQVESLLQEAEPYEAYFRHEVAGQRPGG
ncbi:DUF6879 family protein [Micromonospora radicis]|uniref:DUF6879 domain-containing protein n=1 Tax=Micromonospora radicis TaxID=1894971 RepID=A0A418MQM3_9ACTN|nr:DUF6879 family protein [Micromonospora radicis]RIV36016.1 hypothetical protein D2L64_20440 [Micromonospora radicis]